MRQQYLCIFELDQVITWLYEILHLQHFPASQEDRDEIKKHLIFTIIFALYSMLK